MSNMARETVDLTPESLLTISGREGISRGMAYLSRVERVVTCSNDSDKAVGAWGAENGEQEGMSIEYNDEVRCLAVTRDGKRVLGGGKGKVLLRVWDVETHQPVPEWGGHDTTIRVFDVENGDFILGPIKGRPDYVNCVLDGSRLFRFWDSETGKAIGEPWSGHADYVTLSRNGTKLASASSGEPSQHEGCVWAVKFSPSGEFVACCYFGGKVVIWCVPWWDDSQKEVIAHVQLLCHTISH
jgi:WD40 repeat protein